MPSALKELRTISLVIPQIVERIQKLADNPRPNDNVKLAVNEAYRIRIGDYRVIYSMDDRDKSVTVLKIGHRREIYLE